MNKKMLETLKNICLVIAGVGIFILMLKNPEDNALTIPICIAIFVAIALGLLRPRG